ncbi:VWA domain-containing protein [Isosphaeraceae bacterium EP7]
MATQMPAPSRDDAPMSTVTPVDLGGNLGSELDPSIGVAADVDRWSELARTQVDSYVRPQGDFTSPSTPTTGAEAGSIPPDSTPAGPAPAEAGTPPDEPSEPAPAQAKTARTRVPRLLGRVRKEKARWVLPAWGASAIFHTALLTALAAVSLSESPRSAVHDLESVLVADGESADELVNIYADQAATPRDLATGDTSSTSAGIDTGYGPSVGTGQPSATPNLRAGAAVGERTNLTTVKVVAQVSGLANLPRMAAVDLAGGGGRITGDVMFPTGDVGEALDQIAREIIRHLTQHKLTVVWLFDESESMKDDQQEIRKKFDRISRELKDNVEGDKAAAGYLTHAIVGFGRAIHYELAKPTSDIDQIGKAIDHLRVDESGTENTMHALQDVIGTYTKQMSKDRRLLIVLVTDESGDDGAAVEETRSMAMAKGTPIYVVGRQSLFGYDRAHLRYVDPITKDVYWPAIRRGPETADVELLQWDGLHERWDEQPSGFAPYELARLAKDTGGIYFLLPSEENMRIRQRERAYSISTLKEYVPDYEGRQAYDARRAKSDLRRSMHEIIQITRPLTEGETLIPFRRHFPIEPQAMIEAANIAGAKATEELNLVIGLETRLRALQKLRDREPEKRWQAHYDLMLAQLVAYEIKAYEYRACLLEMVANPPVPKTAPSSELIVEWVLDHSRDRKAPIDLTQKVYLEAERLLKQVIQRHPKTPWADLAQDELDRGLGVQRNEWHHSPRYEERLQFVPKY